MDSSLIDERPSLVWMALQHIVDGVDWGWQLGAVALAVHLQARWRRDTSSAAWFGGGGLERRR